VAKGSSNNNTTTVKSAVVPLGELNQEEHPGLMTAGRCQFHQHFT